jgi:hypothetical protein
MNFNKGGHCSWFTHWEMSITLFQDIATKKMTRSQNSTQFNCTWIHMLLWILNIAKYEQQISAYVNADRSDYIG